MASKLFQKTVASIIFSGAIFFSLDNAINHGHDHYSKMGFEIVEYETNVPWIGEKEKYDIVEKIGKGKILYDVEPKINYNDLINGSKENFQVNELVYFGDTFEFNSFIPKNNLKKSAEKRANYLINTKTNASKFNRLDSFAKENIESLIGLDKSVNKFENSYFL